jgi:SAM-dependent methyltransferase
MAAEQAQIDRGNAAFWDELCGTSLARREGITDASPQSLARFDAAYLADYPYLPGYLPGEEELRGQPTLEVGLGYGTTSQILAARGADYHGLDIAEGPVEMVRHRLAQLGFDDPERRVRRGSILEAPYAEESFAHVVTIGCLHHTGNLARAISQVHRVLRPGGRAVVMVYNRNSWRQIRQRWEARRGKGLDEEEIRASYDHDSTGEAAPATEYASAREAKRELFKDFSEVRTRRENFDFGGYIGWRSFLNDRRRRLGRPAHLAGLDLYVVATK